METIHMETQSQNLTAGSLRMSIFASATATEPERHISVEELVNMVRSPSVGVISTIRDARAALEAADMDKYAALKKRLPAITFSGLFTERNAKKLEAHTGLMGIDFDGLPPHRLAEAREKLISDPHVVFLYVSPSKAGLKGAVRIPTPSGKAGEANEAHRVAFGAVRNYMARNYWLELDEACKDSVRLAFLSHDPGCHHNPDAQPLAVDDWRDLTAEEKEIERLNQLLAKSFLGSIKTPPPPCPLILSTEDGKILGEAGNIVTIEGLMKAGKSAVLSAIIGAAIAPAGRRGDFFGFEVPTAEGFILHIDCEQSEKDLQNLRINAVSKRAGLDDSPDTLVSHTFIDYPIDDRWPALELAATQLQQVGPIRMVIFDGGADFLKKLNDEESAFEMVRTMHTFARKYFCLVVIVIHENPGGEGGKTRGHFGTELWRKSQSCIGVKKGTDGVSSVFGKFLRSGDWPESEAHFFRYCPEAGMHISTEDPTAERRASKAEAKQEKKRDEMVSLANKSMTAPVMTYTALEAAIAKNIGKSERTAQTRIKELVSAGIISKRGDGHYEKAS
jgi:hypothetical protein